MAPDADPYRTLGLPRGASLADVKKAYRRLAKEYHPDAAGETALPRFLAIQAAYDRIVGPDANGAGTVGGARRPGAPREPWDADPTRADATRRAYGGRSRRPRSGGPRASPGSTGRSGSGGTRPPGGPPPPGRTRPERPPNKATLGSTSYDGAEAEPFEPDWGGASWYGTTSGTYWTLNPKEYADPRKHGPEYQARARRAAETAARAAAVDGGPLDATAPVDDPGTVDPATAGPGPSDPVAPAEDVRADGPPPTASPSAAAAPPPPPPTHTTTSWWEATAGPGTAAAAEARRAATATAGQAASADGAVPIDVWAWLEGERPGLPARVGRSIVGWVPFALGLGWAAGEATGCSRFAAACDPTASVLVWLVQVAAFVGLLALPRVATITAIAGLATLAVAVPAAVLLTASGSTSPGGGSAILGGLLVVAWAVGLGIGLLRVMRRGPAPVS